MLIIDAMGGRELVGWMHIFLSVCGAGGMGSKKDEQNVMIGVHPAYLWAGEEVAVCTNEWRMEDEKLVVVGWGGTAQRDLDL